MVLNVLICTEKSMQQLKKIFGAGSVSEEISGAGSASEEISGAGSAS